MDTQPTASRPEMPGYGILSPDEGTGLPSKGSRKARNLRADSRCVATTDNALEPVVIEGVAELVGEMDAIADFTVHINAKYETPDPSRVLRPGRQRVLSPATVEGIRPDRRRLRGITHPLGPWVTRYAVADPFLRFWLRFIGPYIDDIQGERGDLAAGAILDHTSRPRRGSSISGPSVPKDACRRRTFPRDVLRPAAEM